MRTLKIVFFVLAPIVLCGYFWSSARGLTARVAELEAQVEELSAILEFVHVDSETINGLRGPHWIIEGANVHVRSGEGSTTDSCLNDSPGYPQCPSLTGLGNLIVGYNERTNRRGFPPEIRTGSHNVVVGQAHSYPSFAGLVAGQQNEILSEHASVIGGTDNVASGAFSSVGGGNQNVASGVAAVVGGGLKRAAPGELNWAAGSLLETN